MTSVNLAVISGEVSDPESGPDPSFSQTSHALNPIIRSRAIEKAFVIDEFQILIVADRFQSRFNQPLLLSLYIEKFLSGMISPSRPYSASTAPIREFTASKKRPSSLEFINEPAVVMEALKTLYDTAELEDVTDPPSYSTLAPVLMNMAITIST